VVSFSTNDLRMLLEVTGSLHESSHEGFTQRADLTRGLATLLNVDVMVHLAWSDHGQQLEQRGTWGRDARMNAEYGEHYHALDPFAPMLRSRTDPLIVASLVDRSDLCRSEYYSDFLCKYEAYPGISMYLEDAGGVLLDYRFGASDPGKRFGEREVRLLDLLKPHLINAHRLHRIAKELRSVCRDEAASPSFTLRAGKPPRPNRQASVLLSVLEPYQKTALLMILSKVAAGVPAEARWNGFNLCVERRVDLASGGPSKVVHLFAHTAGSAAWFKQRFQMTTRESEVCHLMFCGQSDKQIAVALNISYWTVRVHVGRVLDKLGIESRAAIGQVVTNAAEPR